jgi:hypothetical protein
MQALQSDICSLKSFNVYRLVAFCLLETKPGDLIVLLNGTLTVALWS